MRVRRGTGIDRGMVWDRPKVRADAWPFVVMACCGLVLAFLMAAVLVARGPQG